MGTGKKHKANSEAFLGHYLSHLGDILEEQSKIEVGNMGPCILARFDDIHSSKKKYKKKKLPEYLHSSRYLHNAAP